jgi:hypothetical protein
MNRIPCIRRLAGGLAVLASALLAFAAAAPAALAMNVAPPSGPGAPATITVIAGGMPGWQITLIAIGAALLTATVAVTLDRARAVRRHATMTAA